MNTLSRHRGQELLRVSVRGLSSGLSGSQKNPESLRAADVFRPSFPVEKMTALLDHDNHDMRAKFRQFISEPLMVPRYYCNCVVQRRIPSRA